MVNHIIALLKFHDYVIIPGLGGFISHYESAKRSLSTETITPPSKKIAFNKSLKENDGLLVNQLVSAENLTQAQAKKSIADFNQTVEESLEQSGAYLFRGIGKLTIDANRNLQFYPIIQENLLLDSFGLERLVAQPIQRIKEAYQAELESATLNVIEESNTKEVELSTNEVVYQPVLFRAAAAIGLLFVVGTVFMSLFNGDVNTNQFSFLPVQQAPQTFEATTGYEANLNSINTESTDFVLYTPIEVMTPEIENTAIPTPEVSGKTITAPSNQSYNIIIGSFLDDARMNREIANMKSKGFEVVTLAGPKGYTRVALQFNESNTSKQAQLQTIRNTINKDAWMMSN